MSYVGCVISAEALELVSKWNNKLYLSFLRFFSF